MGANYYLITPLLRHRHLMKKSQNFPIPQFLLLLLYRYLSAEKFTWCTPTYIRSHLLQKKRFPLGYSRTYVGSMVRKSVRGHTEAAGNRHSEIYSVNCVRIVGRKHNGFRFPPSFWWKDFVAFLCKAKKPKVDFTCIQYPIYADVSCLKTACAMWRIKNNWVRYEQQLIK